LLSARDVGLGGAQAGLGRAQLLEDLALLDLELLGAAAFLGGLRADALELLLLLIFVADCWACASEACERTAPTGASRSASASRNRMLSASG
jgi:hypothetical protein